MRDRRIPQYNNPNITGWLSDLTNNLLTSEGSENLNELLMLNNSNSGGIGESLNNPNNPNNPNIILNNVSSWLQDNPNNPNKPSNPDSDLEGLLAGNRERGAGECGTGREREGSGVRRRCYVCGQGSYQTCSNMDGTLTRITRNNPE